MAMKRAALLEKRLRREKETQLRKQQLEAEMEHKKEETRWGHRGRRVSGGTFRNATQLNQCWFGVLLRSLFKH